ncbi:hypothetical protein [Vitreoscilla stercoraria]|uniref:Uncharacterized protein n=1 Tax=Vitreoscilla stercoraria TaxID=61 RepID=A0ABY4ECU8_VITST|nr:hypothetical protein [Vitreoscilla stercoraria]UOO93566.1 hypothetical protein LVJ81_05955 [Vitreoscilla stercoraria]
MQNEHDNNAIPERLMPFLDAVQTDAIHGKPYSQLRHVKEVIVEALALGLVDVFDSRGSHGIVFTYTGHTRYSQQVIANMTNPNK